MKTEEKPGKILDAFHKVPVFILIPFILCILSISLIKHAEFCGYKFGDNAAWVKENIPALVLTLALLALTFLLVYRLGELLDRFSRKQAVLTILYLSAILQVLIILYLPAKQFADQNTVNQISMRIIHGNFVDFGKKGYLYLFPNNIGISLFLSLIYRIFPDTLLVPKLLNVVLSTITSYLIFRIYEETEDNRRNKGYGILLFSGFFPPMLLLNNLVYNDIIATTFFVWSVFSAVRFVKTKNWLHLVLVGVSIIAGDFFRQVGIILLIGVTLYFIIKRISIIKTMAFFAIVILLCRLPLFMVNTYLLRTGKINEPVGKNSIPIHMWINMGMNEKSMGYWDKFYSYNVYILQGQYNKEKSEELYTQMIKKNIQEKGIARIAKVYIKKNVWLWTEGTYQAEYYGIGSWGYLYPTYFTGILQNNAVFRDLTRWTLHASNLMLLVLIWTGLVRSVLKKRNYPLILPAIVLLGFIGFYTLWEIKPRYIYITYPYMILMAYHGLNLIAGKLSQLRKHKD